MTDDDIACSYKRPLHDFISSCAKNHSRSASNFVTPPYSTNNNKESTAIQKNDDDDYNDNDNHHHTFYECNKRLRYTPEDFNLEKHSQLQQSSMVTACSMETASAATSNTEHSKPPSVPWWIQQRQISAPPMTSQQTVETWQTCRVCRRVYTGQQVPSTHAGTNETNSATTISYTKHTTNSNLNNNASTNTLLSYFPLKSTLVDNDKKPRSISFNTMEQLNKRNDSNHNTVNNIGSTSQCHFCEYDNFCGHCPLQSCTTCSHPFCSFCRTVQQNGDVQCIDCYSKCRSMYDTNVNEVHQGPQTGAQNLDAMDVD